jgi:hypothetical protein
MQEDGKPESKVGIGIEIEIEVKIEIGIGENGTGTEGGRRSKSDWINRYPPPLLTALSVMGEGTEGSFIHPDLGQNRTRRQVERSMRFDETI